MVSTLTGVRHVRRIELLDNPAIYLFEVQRREQDTLFVIWERRNAFTGEDDPCTSFTWPWSAPQARAIDVFGATVPTQVRNNHLHLPISLTPVFIEPQAE